MLCRLRATVSILVQWVPCALREGRVCARADAAENTAAGPDLTYCGGEELTCPFLFVRLEKTQTFEKPSRTMQVSRPIELSPSRYRWGNGGIQMDRC